MNIIPSLLLLYQHSGSERISSIQDNEEIISRLKFIGYIEKNQKINCSKLYIQNNNWITSITRTLNGDNRHTCLLLFKDIINRVFEIIEYNQKNNNKFKVISILKDLKKSIEGLENLQQTYKSDVKFCCEIEVVIEKIGEFINKDEYSPYMDNIKSKDVTNKIDE